MAVLEVGGRLRPRRLGAAQEGLPLEVGPAHIIASFHPVAHRLSMGLPRPDGAALLGIAAACAKVCVQVWMGVVRFSLLLPNR